MFYFDIINFFSDRKEAAPRFIRKPHSCIVGEGQAGNFKCRVVAASPPVITWSFQQQVLQAGLKHMPKYSGLAYELRITRCKKDDAGEYTVRAENSYGHREEKCRLTVQRKSQQHDCYLCA